MKLEKFILIIDDEPNVCISIKDQIYDTFGDEFVYELANSAEEALTIIDEILPEIDILITISDWLMPGMKGDEFLITLHKIIPDAVKIMVTGHATQDAIQRAYREANLHQLIMKPWKQEEIIDAIKKGLK